MTELGRVQEYTFLAYIAIFSVIGLTLITLGIKAKQVNARMIGWCCLVFVGVSLRWLRLPRGIMYNRVFSFFVWIVLRQKPQAKINKYVVSFG